MNYKEAIEIIHNEKDKKFAHYDRDVADGYLIALSGKEVKALVEALEEMYENELCWDTKDEEECGECGWCKAKEALNQYHSAIKK